MKKIIQSFLILLITIIGINGVSALDNNYGLYCAYGDYYFIYSGSSLGDIFNIDTNFDQVGVLIESDRPGKSIDNQDEKNWLIEKKVLLSDGSLSCPVNPFGTKLGYPTDKKCGKEGCNVENISNPNESYTCKYKGQSSGKTLSFSYTYNEDGPKWIISYPNGKVKSISGTEINGNFMPGSDCGDIYFVESSKKIVVAQSTSEGISNASLKGLCQKYEEDEIELYCSGNCTFEKDIVCPTYSYNTVKCGAIDDIPAALPQFIKNIINIVKIAVPIILVIMGMLDFAKAVVSSDEKSMKESQTKFIKRVIAAITIFLVVTIVQMVFRIINTDDTNEMASCIDCFINGSCNGGFNIGVDTSTYSCYVCEDDENVRVWTGTDPGSTVFCQSGYYEAPHLSESQCK